MQLHNCGINIIRDSNLDINPLNSTAERSLLLEYYSRNALSASNTFGAGNWATITPDAGTAPDGTNTAVQLSEQAVDVYHHCTTQILNVVSVPYSMSLFAKAGTRSRMWLSNSGTPGPQVAVLDLSTGSIIQQPDWGTVLPLRDVGDGWWEIPYIFEGDLPSTILSLGTVNSGVNTSFQGDPAMHIFIWNLSAFCNRPCVSSTIISVGNNQGSPPPIGFPDPGEASSGTGRWMDSPLQIPFEAPPQAMSGLIEFIEKGTSVTPGAGVWSIGDYVLSSPSLQIGAGASGYEIIHNNAGAVSSALAAFPSIGELVRLRWTLRANGSVQIWQSVNGGAEVAASSSVSSSLAGSWSEGYSWLNSLGASNQGFIAYRQSVVVTGADVSLEELLSHFI